MYILFELSNSQADDNSFIDNHAMGYTNDETTAMKWINENPEYRRYKYCPDKKIKHIRRKQT